jgi:two-component system, chemotaxis family, chemotaxis protein CheY
MRVRGHFRSTSKHPEGFDTRGMPCRVLVVDDDPLTRKLIIQVLKSVGYEIAAEAENGLDAFEQFKAQKPDIVTMDVKMPVLDGLKSLQKIIEFDKDAIVVMLTNENVKELVMEILKAGAADYIVKPITRELILEKLRSVRSKKA